jgi:GntR family transcriptional repressor for pyruvate dehydrogenase complex
VSTGLRTHEVVLNHVEAELLSGRLRVGDRLAGERALAVELNVGRPSVREAIRVLEAMGVIRTSVGSGPESGAIVIADASAGITSALRLHLATSHLPIADLVETRVLLETWSVRQSAARRAPRDLTHAEALLDAMDEAALPAEQFHRLDAEFHVALAHTAGNEVVAAIMASLRGAIHDYVMEAVPNLPDWPSMSRRLRRQHRAVLAAIDDGAADLAADRVSRHIRGFYRSARM